MEICEQLGFFAEHLNVQSCAQSEEPLPAQNPELPMRIRVKRKVPERKTEVRDLLFRLRENLELKRISLDKLTENTDERESIESDLQSFVTEASSIATVKKDDVFGTKLTEEEQRIIQQRVAHQRKQFEEFERRQSLKKISKIKSVHPFITEDEAKQALKESKQDEDEACFYLTDCFNLQHIRKQIALEYSNQDGILWRAGIGGGNEFSGTVTDHTGRRAKTSVPRKSRKSGEQQATNVTYRKLRLDDAIAQGNMEGWSEARKRAWAQRASNPNAYYYRFNEPGEMQRNGKWTKTEIELFFRRMKEVGVNGQWGIFSQSIPGRVGYQCSNFYRHLIETNQIQDPNYYLDEKGKAHYRFKNKQQKKEEEGFDGTGIKENGNDFDDSHGGLNSLESAKEPKSLKKRQKRKKRRKRYSDGDQDDEDGDKEFEDREADSDDDYRPSRKPEFEVEEEDEESIDNSDNPLPGYIDPVTLCEVIKPAISPYGHVSGYANWSRILSQEPRNICPFTKKPLKKRDLVILTWENIEQYRDRIVTLSEK